MADELAPRALPCSSKDSNSIQDAALKQAGQEPEPFEVCVLPLLLALSCSRGYSSPGQRPIIVGFG